MELTTMVESALNELPGKKTCPHAPISTQGRLRCDTRCAAFNIVIHEIVECICAIDQGLKYNFCFVENELVPVTTCIRVLPSGEDVYFTPAFGAEPRKKGEIEREEKIVVQIA